MTWTTEECICRGKREILADIAHGTVPPDVANFAQLHDYVDANGYGGAFEDDAPIPSDWLFWNTVQDALNAWLRAGRPD